MDRRSLIGYSSDTPERSTIIDVADIDKRKLEDAKDGTKIEVKEIQGDTLVNLSKTKEKRHLIGYKCTGNEMSLDNYNAGRTLINRISSGSESVVLNDKINVTGTNEVVLDDTVDNGKVDVVIEGNTLVNLYSDLGYLISNNEYIYSKKIDNGFEYGANEGKETRNIYPSNMASINTSYILKPLTDYTIIFNCNVENDVFSVQYRSAEQGNNIGDNAFSVTSKKGINKLKINIPQNIYDQGFTIRFRMLEGVNDTIQITNIILLEGDYTDKEIPEYFEGMKSVGELENNNIEIKSRGKNLFDGNFIENKILAWLTGAIVTSSNAYCSDYIQIKSNVYYAFNKPASQLIVYDKDKKYIGAYSKNGTLIQNTGNDSVSKFEIQDSTAKYIRFSYRNITDASTVKNIQLEEGNAATSYMPYKEDTIIYNIEPLRGLPNGAKDRIVYKNNKWYIERNCTGEIVSSSWIWIKSTITPNYYFYGNNKFAFNDNTINVVCDKLKSETTENANISEIYENQDTYVAIGSAGINGAIIIDLKDGELEEDTIQGFKNWLDKAKPFIIYPLQTSIYEEITSPQLLTYLDKTYITTNSLIPTKLNVSNSGIELRNIEPNQKYVLNKTGNNPVKVDLCGNEQNYSDILTTTDMVNNQMKLYGKSTTLTDMTLLKNNEQVDYTSYISDTQHIDGENVELDKIVGHTLINRIDSNNETLILNDKIDVTGTNEIALTDTVDNGKVDVIVEGNTLINICCLPDNKTATTTTKELAVLNSVKFNNRAIIKPNTTYTVMVEANVDKASSNSKIYCEGAVSNVWFTSRAYTNVLGYIYFAVKFTTSDKPLGYVMAYTAIGSLDGNEATATTTITNAIILEGDYTNKPIPDYFEGMKSVGQECKNLVNLNKFTKRTNASQLTIQDDSITVVDNYYSINMIDVKPNTNYTLSYNATRNNEYAIDYVRVCAPDLSSQIKDVTGGATFNTGNYNQIALLIYGANNANNPGSTTYSNIQLEEGTTATDYLRHYDGAKLKFTTYACPSEFIKGGRIN